MPLGRAREPFSHPDWLFEAAMAIFLLESVENARCFDKDSPVSYPLT
jgi:hypothetical protein